VGGKTTERTFTASRERVVAAMTRAAAELGFSILSSQPDAGVVSFNTGRSWKSWTGQDLSATAIAISSSDTKVIVGGSLAVRGSGPKQVGSWGEKSALSKKFIDKIDEVLPSVVEAERVTAGGGTTGVADELKKIADLRDAGILSEGEFEGQKARLLAG
jgi:hypothetical protein